MSEIDFDELDRAVTSAISNINPTPASDLVGSSQPRLSVSPRPSDSQSHNSTDISRPELSMPIIPSRPVVERPKTGRFLDMVHSSANMKNTMRITSAAPVQTPAISQPQNTFGNDSLKNNLMSVPNKPQFSNQSIPKIDYSEPKSPDDNLLLDLNKISAEMSKNLSSNFGENADSPFLADAKVEKRPLNALAPDSQPVTFAPDNGVQEKVLDTPLPAELESKLLSIESNVATKNTDEIVIEDENENEDESKEQSTSDVVEMPGSSQDMQKPNEVEIKPEQTKVNPAELAQTPAVDANKISVNSIPQQYQEKPSSTQQASGAIYDVKDYHKVAPINKKKSGWSWVLWTIILIIASVGAGVAVYFFVLPEM